MHPFLFNHQGALNSSQIVNDFPLFAASNNDDLPVGGHPWSRPLKAHEVVAFRRTTHYSSNDVFAGSNESLNNPEGHNKTNSAGTSF